MIYLNFTALKIFNVKIFEMSKNGTTNFIKCIDLK